MKNTKSELKVGAAQIETVLGDVTANLRKHLDMIVRARAAAIDVLMFPELSLTGYALGARSREIALRADDQILRDIANAAGPMAVTVGYVEAADGGRPYNAAVTLRDGDILQNHRKLNLPGYGRLEEPNWFAGGTLLDGFDLGRGWRACTLVCADLWNPALVHIAACGGASLLLVPISSSVEAVGEDFDNPRGWQVALDFYAMMYGLPIVMANRVGPEGEFTAWGGSRVLDPSGRTIARAADGDDLIVATLSLADVAAAQTRLPTVRDSDPALVRAEFERLAAARSAA
jgi:N-carbamoylputrescine amidase